MREETVGETLQRLARASLPRHFEGRDKNDRRRCVCGEFLPVDAKTRQGRKVCDACAEITPRTIGGRQPTCVCAECRAVYPRLKLKVKNGNFYCKKCLKIKFDIDF